MRGSSERELSKRRLSARLIIYNFSGGLARIVATTLTTADTVEGRFGKI